MAEVNVEQSEIHQKKKTYWQIFAVLTVLTVFELSIVFAPIPAHLITLLVVVASLAKACSVGWWYMHLNHESKGLHFILTFPLFVAFFYAVFLISDAKMAVRRHANEYVGEPKRFFGQRRLIDREVDDFGNTIIHNPDLPHPAQGDSASASSTSTAGGTADSGTLPAHAGTVEGKITTDPGAAQSGNTSSVPKK